MRNRSSALSRRSGDSVFWGYAFGACWFSGESLDLVKVVSPQSRIGGVLKTNRAQRVPFAAAPCGGRQVRRQAAYCPSCRRRRTLRFVRWRFFAGFGPRTVSCGSTAARCRPLAAAGRFADRLLTALLPSSANVSIRTMALLRRFRPENRFMRQHGSPLPPPGGGRQVRRQAAHRPPAVVGECFDSYDGASSQVSAREPFHAAARQPAAAPWRRQAGSQTGCSPPSCRRRRMFRFVRWRFFAGFDSQTVSCDSTSPPPPRAEGCNARPARCAPPLGRGLKLVRMQHRRPDAPWRRPAPCLHLARRLAAASSAR